LGSEQSVLIELVSLAAGRAAVQRDASTVAGVTSAPVRRHATVRVLVAWPLQVLLHGDHASACQAWSHVEYSGMVAGPEGLAPMHRPASMIRPSGDMHTTGVLAGDLSVHPGSTTVSPSVQAPCGFAAWIVLLITTTSPAS
jgi:hypothetical protein